MNTEHPLTLVELWNKQLEIETKFVSYSNQDPTYKATWTKEYCLAIVREIGELLDAVPQSKSWKKSYPPLDIDNLHEELVDIGHFWVALCLLWNLDPHRFVEVYLRKHRENLRRYGSEY